MKNFEFELDKYKQKNINYIIYHSNTSNIQRWFIDRIKFAMSFHEIHDVIEEFKSIQ